MKQHQHDNTTTTTTTTTAAPPPATPPLLFLLVLVLVECAGNLEQFFEQVCQAILQSCPTCPTWGVGSKIACILAILVKKVN